MIGVISTFYGYKGRDILEKVKKLIMVFKSLGLPPYIQLQSSIRRELFEDIALQLSALKKEFGVKYSLHQSLWLPAPDFFLNLGSSDPKIKEGTLLALKKSIDFARTIGAENISFHAGYATNIVTQEEEFQPLKALGIISYQEAYLNVKKNLKELLEYANRDVKLSVENLNYRPESRYLFSSPEDFKDLPENIGVLFDTGHAYYSQNKTGNQSYLEDMIDIVGGKITELHASDNNGSEDQHKLPGLGKVPFSEIFQKISGRQELPPVIIEAAQKKHNYSQEDLKKSIKFLQKLCPR